ncbi:hypothetical protein [Priestia flexa]|uniref:Uncharacterized protein n=1 Tax=Priestia flexa TaxID=86664 RepID=A0ABU4JBW1_9BACI|nr:hypothetical protein [Priestia flexa]MDW8518500.1 hypothetical protein [Priestia flexa]
MKELADLNYKELDSLSVEEKLKFLEEEFNMYEMNSQLQYDISQLSENNIIKFLESVVNGKSNFEVTQAGEYPAKKVAGIYKHANIEESEFFELLRILYLNDYVEVFKYKEFHIEEESVNSIFDNTPDNTHQHRYNLHRLYKTSKELFNEENYNGMENKGSEATMYYKFLKYGTIVDKICSYNTLIRLSNKGIVTVK